MADPQFVIYGSPDGYTAITNPIRRRILEALEQEDLELPDLVEVTDRSKSTLSSIHMPNLIERGLIEERPHPTDGRKKRFHLVGRRIGSSDLPVEELRGAVREYVTGGQGRQQATARVALASIASAPDGTGASILRAQGRRLGQLMGQDLEGASNAVLMSLSSGLDKMGVARTLRIDLEDARLDLEIARGWAADVPADHAVHVVAGFLAGLAGISGNRTVDVQPLEGELRARFQL